jgi:hypothetical protein
LPIFLLFFAPSRLALAEDISVRVRPMGLLFGIPGGELQAEITPHFEAGPSFHYSAVNNNANGSDLQVSETGVRATGFFWGELDTSAWFVTASLYYYETHLTQEVPGLNLQQDPSVRFGSFGSTLTAGRQWMLNAISPAFGQHVNLRLGGGVGYKPGHTENVSSSTGSPYVLGVFQRFDPTLEFTIGVIL